MSLLPLSHRLARRRAIPAGRLAAPGPFPGKQPENVTVIFVVVLVVVVWLLARGYPAGTAVEAVAGAATVSVVIASRLAGQPEDAG